MISDICLIWIGIQLNAPVWYYWLVGVRLFINLVSFGVKVGKAVKE